jgi:aspartate-semialdehyde dehydrogenase
VNQEVRITIDLAAAFKRAAKVNNFIRQRLHAFVVGDNILWLAAANDVSVNELARLAVGSSELRRF